jgi:hypothetical protein
MTTTTKPTLPKELKDRAQDYPGVWRWVRYSNPEGTDPEALREELERKLNDLDRGYSDTMEYFHDFRKAERKEKRRAEKRLRLLFQWPRPGWDWLRGDLVQHTQNPNLFGVVQQVEKDGQTLYVLAVGDKDTQIWKAPETKLVRRG